MAGNLDHGDDELTESHEINVTPFIDVILVLLIIFMVAAPLATVDVAVDLPVSATPAQARTDKPIFLTLKADTQLVLGDAATDAAALPAALDAASGGDRAQRVFLRADRSVPYGELMAAMEVVRQAGYLRIGLVAAAAEGLGQTSQ